MLGLRNSMLQSWAPPRRMSDSMESIGQGAPIFRAATFEEVDDEVDSEDTTMVALCSRCRELDLTIDDFVIDKAVDTGSQHRGPNAFYSNEHDKIIGSRFSLRTGRTRQEFAKLGQLRSNRHDCGFCQLALEAIKRYGRSKLTDETQCYLTWEVDGRSRYPEPDMADKSDEPRRSARNKTRRLKLSWDEYGCQGHVYLVLAVPPSTPSSGPETMPGQVQNTHSLGREFYDPTEKQYLIRSWLNTCLMEHQDTCSPTHGTMSDFLKLVDETYFGVIDVLDMRLKRLPIRLCGRERVPDQYVALSYVWGKGGEGGRYVTSESTIMKHLRHGGLATVWGQLPTTIQDAILLVNRLGERYLWVDSLCIVQDNRRSWENNAKAMHLIYGHAYFTICAADGDVDSGLRAAEPMLPAFRTNKDKAFNGVADDGLDLDDTAPITAQYAHGIRILVIRPLEVVIRDSVWSTRAWTFQEQILSRRCLIFAEGRVYFQCRFARTSEDIWTDNSGNGWSLNRANSPLQSPRQLTHRPIWFYLKFVHSYTSRSLSKAKDILSAFEGITWLLQEHMDDERFLFGLPTSHFDLALLWTPTKALRRRRAIRSHSPLNESCLKDQTGHCTCKDEEGSFGNDEFPSWSWCGWMADGGAGGQSIYQEAMLIGCLSNVSKWLERHTWIKWFVRDEKGHLMPLRDNARRTWRRDIYEEDRWSGYSGGQAWEPVLEGAKTIQAPFPDTDRTRKSTPRPKSSLKPGDATASASASASNQLVKYRVGNGAYLRRGSYIQPTRESPTQRDRQLTWSRVLQDRSASTPEKDGLDAIIPENPFGTIRERDPFTQRGRRAAADTLAQVPRPEYMMLLQFRTIFKKLHVAVRDSPGPWPATELCVCDVADDFGDWCGCVTVARAWIERQQQQRGSKGFDFIAISEAKEFAAEECPVWTYYIPKEREESQWDLFYVLLLERDEERCLWERVALGKIFQAAFENASWAEIKLG